MGTTKLHRIPTRERVLLAWFGGITIAAGAAIGSVASGGPGALTGAFVGTCFALAFAAVSTARRVE